MSSPAACRRARSHRGGCCGPRRRRAGPSGRGTPCSRGGRASAGWQRPNGSRSLAEEEERRRRVRGFGRGSDGLSQVSGPACGGRPSRGEQLYIRPRWVAIEVGPRWRYSGFRGQEFWGSADPGAVPRGYRDRSPGPSARGQPRQAFRVTIVTYRGSLGVHIFRACQPGA